MLDEAHFIPFLTENVPNGRWLVFAPHADDESFGMGGSLLLASQHGCAVSVVIMTDGALGGNDGQLVAIRKREAEQAAHILGLEQLVLMPYADRSLQLQSDSVQYVASCIRRLQPDNIFFPSWYEFHPDHRATAQIVWRAMQLIGFSGNVFSYEISCQQHPVNFLVDISDVYQQKKALMAVYQSQLAENHYIDIVTAINRSRTYTLTEQVQFAEAFYRFEDINSPLAEVMRAMTMKYCQT